MKKSLIRLSAVLLPTIMLLACSGKAGIILTDNGTSPYRIVIPENASKYESRAAAELSAYLQKLGGAVLPVVTDREDLLPYEIIIGDNRHLGLIKCRVNTERLGTDGYHIRTSGNYLVIAGGSGKGCLYGVYSLLEALGCRFYTPDFLYLPPQRDIFLDDIFLEEVPAFEFREMLFPYSADSAYLLWHKLDRHQNGEWGMWVHTFDKLLPPENYFKNHPEYYSLINGRRVPDGQLCLSNPEVLDLVVSNLSRKILANPAPRYWSVSQNDNFLVCSCEHCKELDRKYGGPSGTMVHFVNEVAEKFPDRVISTLAYQYTRPAPKGIKPAKNVNIMLCTIECNRSLPIGDDPSGKSFVKDLRDWSRLTKNILLWDYVVQFRNYISPFPNFGVLQPNLQLFKKYGCNMMFQQGSGSSWSDFAELKAYLIARLLWNPETDPDAIVNDFIYGYYGDAAPFIRQYFDMLHEELRSSGENLWIYGYPFDGVSSYLSPSLLIEYQKLLDQAEEAVKDRPEILARVKKTRLPLDFAVLDISLHQYDEMLSYFYQDDDIVRVKPVMRERLDAFVDGCHDAGIERLQEHGTSPVEYRENVEQYISKSLEPSLARSKHTVLLSAASAKYDAGGEKALTDGLRGTDDFHFNWLGFEGADLKAVIDLEELTSVSLVSASFLQSNYSWIFLPLEVNYYASENGIDYTLIGKVSNVVPDTQPGSFAMPFSIDIPQTSLRFLKIEAVSMKTCPSWHIGAGEKSWIFVDEVVVQ